MGCRRSAAPTNLTQPQSPRSHRGREPDPDTLLIGRLPRIHCFSHRRESRYPPGFTWRSTVLIRRRLCPASERHPPTRPLLCTRQRYTHVLMATHTSCARPWLTRGLAHWQKTGRLLPGALPGPQRLGKQPRHRVTDEAAAGRGQVWDRTHRLLGLADDARVTAADMDGGLLARHSHGGTWGGKHQHKHRSREAWEARASGPAASGTLVCGQRPESKHTCPEQVPARGCAELHGPQTEGGTGRGGRDSPQASPQASPQGGGSPQGVVSQPRAHCHLGGGQEAALRTCRPLSESEHRTAAQGGHVSPCRKPFLPPAEATQRRPRGPAGPAWKRVPGGQADGLLQEGELGVVEAEDLVHGVRLGLHRQAEHGQGPAAAAPEQHLRGAGGAASGCTGLAGSRVPRGPSTDTDGVSAVL